MRNPPPPPPEGKSFHDFQEWQERVHGNASPESELRQVYATNPDGSIGSYRIPKSLRDTVSQTFQKPDYSHIRLPALALMAIPAGLQVEIQRYQPATDEERAAMKEVHDLDVAIATEHVQELRTGMKNCGESECSQDLSTRSLRQLMAALLLISRGLRRSGVPGFGCDSYQGRTSVLP
jgi:hypothetical protein